MFRQLHIPRPPVDQAPDAGPCEMPAALTSSLMCIKACTAAPGDASGSFKQMGTEMPEIDRQDEARIREAAYFQWLDEGCPEGRADDHWTLACTLLAAAAPEGMATGEPAPDQAASPEDPAPQ